MSDRLAGLADLFVPDVAHLSMTGRKRMESLVHTLGSAILRRVPGDFVETGVWRGGNLVLAGQVIAAMDPDGSRAVWGYDTFEGMPEPGEADARLRGGVHARTKWQETRMGNGSGWCRAGESEVRAVLSRLMPEHVPVRLVRGLVEDTLHRPENLPDAICVLRIDTDFYSSHKAALETLWPLLSCGGFLVLDDYGHWSGAKKAVDEFFRLRPGHVWADVDHACRIILKEAEQT